MSLYLSSYLIVSSLNKAIFQFNDCFSHYFYFLYADIQGWRGTMEGTQAEKEEKICHTCQKAIPFTAASKKINQDATNRHDAVTMSLTTK